MCFSISNARGDNKNFIYNFYKIIKLDKKLNICVILFLFNVMIYD